MRRSKAVAGWALVASTALVLTACSGGGGETGDTNTGTTADIKSMATGKAQNGENFRLAETQPFDEITLAIDDGYSAYNNDAASANNSYNTFVLVATLAGAGFLDGNNKPILNNDVMESWTVTSPNPQVVQWKIKPNVKWSDGEAWDCDDFYLSWLSHNNLIKENGGAIFQSSSTSGYEFVREASCKDPLTFEAKFEKPFLDYKSMFNPTAVLPAHIMEKAVGIQDITTLNLDSPIAELKKVADYWNTKWTGFNPATMPGSGPYMISDYVPNTETVTLTRNPHWIGAKGGPNKIIVRGIPDTKAAATALQNGEIDVLGSVQPDQNAANTLKGLASQGVLYGSAPRLSFEHLDMNFTRPLFQDEAVRKAFFEVVNRQEIVDKLLKDVQADIKPLNGIIYFPGEEGYQDVYADKTGKGAEAAAKTLSDAGWVKGPDGIFAKNGTRLSFTITHNENARRSQTVELIIPMAKAAGIEVKDETDANFLKGRVNRGDYDVALFGWSATPFKSDQLPIYSTKAKGGSENYQGLSNEALDKALAEAVVATDPAAAMRSYQQADKLLAESYATLPLFQTPSMWGFRGIDRVYMQSYYGALWNVGEWVKNG
ncbi:ABC transporter family substrate-binding protein [Amycolatopsis suaedae]|uniref:ABC transporter family substrate-binding protein n=1 Tax=Amycolatopsis suaedae TaxID=2510978 RepID=A0A4Q7J9A7_9PSEU|nr:ABC transporter family substrate-binding protein [Amycolatopsis suaedae]RZQ63588.1 ABC transporter family substrate-binding protein [Amycolatopsis suaedae]